MKKKLILLIVICVMTFSACGEDEENSADETQARVTTQYDI